MVSVAFGFGLLVFGFCLAVVALCFLDSMFLVGAYDCVVVCCVVALFAIWRFGLWAGFSCL